MDVVCILHNIRSTHNVGAMFRTADGAGVTKMFLTGYTPDPVNRFGFPQKEIAKAALGAEASIAWEHPRSVHTLIARLKREGYTIVALEQHATSVHYRKAKVGKKFALIVGNEVTGVDAPILKKADCIVEIPLRGVKESLNVATAFGIGLFALAKI